VDKDILSSFYHCEVCAATVLFMMIFGNNPAFFLHTPAEHPLTDLGFLVIPEISPTSTLCKLYDDMTVVGFFLGFFHTFGLTRSERCRVLSAEVRIMTICYFLRTLTTPLTSLPGPAAHCRPGSSSLSQAPSTWIEMVRGFGPHVQGYNTCGDLIFSGHMCYTTVSLLLYLRHLDVKYSPEWSWKRWSLGGLYLMMTSILCVAARKHYTVDVVLGILIATLVYFHFEHGWIPLAWNSPSPLLSKGEAETTPTPSTSMTLCRKGRK